MAPGGDGPNSLATELVLPMEPIVETRPSQAIAPAVHLEFIQNQAGLSDGNGLDEIEAYHRALFLHHHASEVERFQQQERLHEARLDHLEARLKDAHARLAGLEKRIPATLDGEPDVKPSAPWNGWDRVMFATALMGITALAEAKGNATRLENEVFALVTFAKSLFQKEVAMRRDQSHHKQLLLDQITEQIRNQLQKVGVDAPVTGPGRYALDPGQTKIEMLRITRNVGVADWITRETLPNPRPASPTSEVGPMKIGIRWTGPLDVDLYASATPHSETLFFEHTRCPEGYYFKDYRSSPNHEYEFIEFTSPVNVWQVTAMVNFYKGSAPGGPTGEIRIEFGGQVYSGPFAIQADHGNEGRSGTRQAAFWTRIDIPRILRLPGPPLGTAARN